MIESTLAALLLANTELAQLVGDRVYPLAIPQEKPLPAVAYQKISGPRIHTMSGPTDLSNPRVQFTAWALSYGDAKRVIERLRLAIYGGLPGAIITDLPDRFEPESKRYGVAVDVRVLYRDTNNQSPS